MVAGGFEEMSYTTRWEQPSAGETVQSGDLTDEAMSTLTLHLTPAQRQAIDQLASSRQVSAEAAILQAVEQALAQGEASRFPAGSPFHGMDDLFDNLGDGPADLSTNRAYLDTLGR